MANVELELISNVVENGDWRDITSAGLLPDHFISEEGYLVFKWLFEEHKLDGEVPNRARLLRRFPSFEFCPSRNPIAALARELRQTNVRVEATEILEEIQDALEDGDDPMEILQLHLPELRDLQVEFAEPDGLLLSKAAHLEIARYESTENAGGITGIPYPWAPLNEATGGMQRGQFIVFYARPKQMKTFTACEVAVHAYIESGQRVAVYSKEMTKEQMLGRCAASIAGVPYEKVRTGSLSEEQRNHYFDVLEQLGDVEDEWRGGAKNPAMLFLSDKGVKGGSTPESLRNRIEKFAPDVVLVDGFYLMRDARTKKKDRDWKTVSNISADLKEMAIEMDVIVIGTTQANRGAEKDAKNISADDLSGLAFADAIGQDADAVIQIIKGKAPEGHPILLLLFPGIRDAEISPFVINARPGVDFSLRQRKVNIKAFIEDAKKAWASEDGEDGGGGGSSTPKEPAEKKPRSKPRRSRLRS